MVRPADVPYKDVERESSTTRPRQLLTMRQLRARANWTLVHHARKVAGRDHGHCSRCLARDARCRHAPGSNTCIRSRALDLVALQLAILAATDGLSVDVGFGAAGLHTTFKSAMRSWRKDGRFVIVGFMPRVSFYAIPAVNDALTLPTSYRHAYEKPVVDGRVRRSLSNGGRHTHRLTRGCNNRRLRLARCGSSADQDPYLIDSPIQSPCPNLETLGTKSR